MSRLLSLAAATALFALLVTPAHAAKKAAKPPPAAEPAKRPAGPVKLRPEEGSGEVLARARARFENLEYEEVLPLVEALLKRDDLPLPLKLEAYFLQGSAIAITSDPFDAERAFRLLLRTRPDWEPPGKTPPRVMAVFRKVQVEEKTLAAQVKKLAREALVSEIRLQGEYPKTGQGGYPLPFGFRLKDPKGGVETVRVAYRRRGQPSYSTLALERSDDGTWRGEIPGDFTASESGFAMEYYVETADSEGPLVTAGSVASPLITDLTSGTVERAVPPPLPRWAFFATAGAAAALAVAGGAFGLATSSTQGSYQELLDEGQGSPVDGARLTEVREQGEFRATATNLFLGTAAVATVAAAVMYPFTNFSGQELPTTK